MIVLPPWCLNWPNGSTAPPTAFGPGPCLRRPSCLSCAAAWGPHPRNSPAAPVPRMAIPSGPRCRNCTRHARHPIEARGHSLASSAPLSLPQHILGDRGEFCAMILDLLFKTGNLAAVVSRIERPRAGLLLFSPHLFLFFCRIFFGQFLSARLSLRFDCEKIGWFRNISRAFC